MRDYYLLEIKKISSLIERMRKFIFNFFLDVLALPVSEVPLSERELHKNMNVCTRSDDMYVYST